MNLVERVARIIDPKSFKEWEEGDHFTRINRVGRLNTARATARAAIEAMRDPTDGMMLAGGLKCEELMFEDPTEATGVIFKDMGVVFRTMIDAALAAE